MDDELEGLLALIKDKITSLVPQGGMDNPTQREFIQSSGIMDGTMTLEEMKQLPIEGFTNMEDSLQEKQFLDSMPEPDRLQVEDIRQRLTKTQFQELLRQLMSGKVGSGAIHDSLPFQQYETGNPHLANLGFQNQQLASNDYYNQDLGIFLPQSYESGYTSGAGRGEQFNQNYMRQGREKYKYPYRYGMGGTVRDLDFT